MQLDTKLHHNSHFVNFFFVTCSNYTLTKSRKNKLKQQPLQKCKVSIDSSPLTPQLTGMILRTPTPTPTQNHSNHGDDGDGGDGGGTLLHDETLPHQRGLSRAASRVVMKQGNKSV